MASNQMGASANTVAFYTMEIMARICMSNTLLVFMHTHLSRTSSNDVLGLQIDAADTLYAANNDSQRAFETLIDGDQWMVYRNVKTDVLHWDLVSRISFSTHSETYVGIRAPYRGSSLSLSLMLSE